MHPLPDRPPPRADGRGAGEEGDRSGKACPPATDVLNRVLTRYVRNEDEFLDFVDEELPAMLLPGVLEEGVGYHRSSSLREDVDRIGLVVLDSIAGLFRSQKASSRLRASTPGGAGRCSMRRGG